MINAEAMCPVIANPAGPTPLILTAQNPPNPGVLPNGHFFPPELIIMGEQTNLGSSDRQDMFALGMLLSIMLFGREFLRRGTVSTCS